MHAYREREDKVRMSPAPKDLRKFSHPDFKTFYLYCSLRKRLKMHSLMLRKNVKGSVGVVSEAM